MARGRTDATRAPRRDGGSGVGPGRCRGARVRTRAIRARRPRRRRRRGGARAARGGRGGVGARLSDLVVIVGPTASGKSALALEVAPELGAEIVTADSRQVYRGMDVGTAKPTRADRESVPHHLLDLVEPDQTYDVSRYQRDADAVLAELEGRGRLAVVVGGTGLYVRAVVDGLGLSDLPHDPALR
ncbi:MAG: hypothetical protein E6I87_02410, partial [Chloroflexi bacterium]